MYSVKLFPRTYQMILLEERKVPAQDEYEWRDKSLTIISIFALRFCKRIICIHACRGLKGMENFCLKKSRFSCEKKNRKVS